MLALHGSVRQGCAMMHGVKSRFARAVACAASLVLAFGMGGCAFTTPSLADAKQDEVQQVIDDSLLVQPGTLTVALDTSNRPQVLTKKDGTIEGYYVDVATDLADNLGLEVSFVNAPSASAALDSGAADIFLGATSADESSDIMVSGELCQNATAVFGLSEDGASLTVNASDLASARVGVQDGSASQEALANVNVVASNTYSNSVNECFDALEAGEIDYVVCDATSGGNLARTYENCVFAGVISASTSYGIAFRSSDTELAEAVNSVVETIGADGTLDAMHQLWYGSVPMNLSSALLTGITLPTTDDEASDDGAAGGGSSDGTDAQEDEPTITEDINSLD